MLILGVDPGIGRCGYGLVTVNNSQLTVNNYGCIETKPNETTEQRLLVISRKVESLIKKYKPDILAIEELFFGTNSKTALTVGQARGVVLLLAAESNIPVSIYTPLQVKMALTGYGRADKNQIAQMVKVLLKLNSVPKPDDTADALAIALTHAFSSKVSKLYK